MTISVEARAWQVINPLEAVAGISQRQLAEQWWRWTLTIPMAINPLLDPTGDYAGIHNDGPVFFIAGNLAGESNRRFDVPVNRPIFFPVMNIINTQFPQIRPNCFDLAPADQFNCGAIPNELYINEVTNLSATLDDQDLLIYPSFRQTSHSFFDVTLPDDNLYRADGVSAGTYPKIALSDGFWIAVDGLPPGVHTLRFGADTPHGTRDQVTATLVVPEPNSAGAMFAAIAVLVSLRNRRSSLRGQPHV